MIGGEGTAALAGGGSEASMVDFFESWVKELHSSLDALGGGTGAGGGEPLPAPAPAAPLAASKLTDAALVKDISKEVSERLRDLWD